MTVTYPATTWRMHHADDPKRLGHLTHWFLAVVDRSSEDTAPMFLISGGGQLKKPLTDADAVGHFGLPAAEMGDLLNKPAAALAVDATGLLEAAGWVLTDGPYSVSADYDPDEPLQVFVADLVQAHSVAARTSGAGP